MILYIEYAKDSTRKLLELNEFGKFSGCKINTHKSVAFLYIYMQPVCLGPVLDGEKKGRKERRKGGKE